jgi:hypothetical protein
VSTAGILRGRRVRKDGLMASVPSAFALFPVIAPALKKLAGVDWAIGGAGAMALHGYHRETQDLDVFFHGRDVARVLREVRKVWPKVATIADPYHFAIFPDLTEPDRRIDLLFAWDDAESDAVEFPDETDLTIDGVSYHIQYFPVLLLVACKLLSDRPRDHEDVRRLHERGLFDPVEEREILRRLGDDEDAVRRLLAMAVPAAAARRRGGRR